MPDFKDRMADYVPVNERVEAFKAAFPEGSLQSEIVELTPGRVTVKALAYRTPDDPRPGIGHSSLEIPGSTPYTRGSEIENAETSAWGRAIAALGFEVKRGLASAEEVRNKQPQGGERAAPVGGAQPATTRPAVQRTPEENALLDELLAVPGMSNARMNLLSKAVDVKGERATADELREMLALTVMPPPEPPGPVVPNVAPATDTPAPDSDPVEASEAGGLSVVPPDDGPPAPQPTLDDVLAVTGGELVEGDGSNITIRMAPPPQAGTEAYKALTGPEKAAARAYWQRQASAEAVATQ